MIVVTEPIPPQFIEIDGDLISPSHIASVKYWPAKSDESDHRVILRTTEGGLWDLYRGPSKEAAIEVRDALVLKLRGM